MRAFSLSGSMKIRGHKIEGVEYIEAHAFNRQADMAPELIILHDTAGRLDKFSSVNWFKSEECPNSAHVVIERDGTIVQMVPFNRRAYHAGPSTWDGRPYCNNYSIGIEIVSPGKLDKDGRAWFHKKTEKGFPGVRRLKSDKHGGEGYWLDYTSEQIEAVTNLCKAICGAYPDVRDVSTHYLVSPGRKVDVGPHFPLEDVRRAAISVRRDGTADVVEPIAAEATPVGMLSNMNFSKLDELANQGSRVAVWIRSAKRYLWGTTVTTGTAVTAAANTGTGNAFMGLVRDHPFITLAIGGAIVGLVVYVLLKAIEKFLVTAAKDGRYKPRGE